MKGSLAPHRVTPATLSLPLDEASSPCLSSPSSTSNHNFSAKPCCIESSDFFDLIVIGAGPAGLALVARILESRPAALYTDQEHLYLHWLQRNRNPALLKTRRKGVGNDRIAVGNRSDRNKHRCCDGRMRILVIDKLGEGWMTNWNRQFAAFDIKHLRSPLFFHPDPADLDALIAFAERENRHTCGPPSLLYTTSAPPSTTRPGDSHTYSYPELIEIPGCVGAEISKHKRASRRSRQESNYARLVQNNGPAVNERDRRDYFTPGTTLFRDFCQRDVVERYDLSWTKASTSRNTEQIVETRPVTTIEGQVSSLTWSPLHIQGSGLTDGFYVRTANGACFGAKSVVCVVGMGGCPSVPAPLLASPTPEPRISSSSTPAHGPGWAHSSCLPDPAFTFPPPYANKGTLVVIGGGLTSAQICDLGLRKGFLRVILIMRGHLKVKPFDVSLDWMGRYSNLKKMQFWQEEDPLQRLNMLRSARNGGSITPTYVKVLKMHEDRGVLQLRTMANLVDAHWDGMSKTWALEIQTTGTSPPKDVGSASRIHLETIAADYIVAATGTVPSFLSLPFIQTLMQNPRVPPCHTVGGLPMLTSNLQWPGLPLFFVGGYSALQVGPGAFNLGGMREAADRIVERLEQLAIGREAADAAEDDPIADEGAKSNYTYFDFNLLSVES